MPEITRQEIATEIRRITSELNAAIEKAVELGLDVTVEKLEKVGNGSPYVYVKVSLEL